MTFSKKQKMVRTDLYLTKEQNDYFLSFEYTGLSKSQAIRIILQEYIDRKRKLD